MTETSSRREGSQEHFVIGSASSDAHPIEGTEPAPCVPLWVLGVMGDFGAILGVGQTVRHAQPGELCRNGHDAAIVIVHSFGSRAYCDADPDTIAPEDLEVFSEARAFLDRVQPDRK